LSYPWLRLVIEYDGRQHADDSKQWHRDLARREQLDISRWRISVVTSRGIFREPHQTLRRVEQALRERGCTSLPRGLDDGWRRHFPVS
ncbi:MAG: hypothetical protein ACRDP4_08165, partial [Nocardioidaceae bacterium]